MSRLWRAGIASAGLSALFLAVYGGCNWFTSLRTLPPSWHMPWERGIPFVPALIVPYLSIDLFFIAAPFLAVRRAGALRVLVLRIVTAILLAGACFLVMPLRFGFDRPDAPGALGALIAAFRTLDPPFNEFPSLHVALCLLLLEVYWQGARGLWRTAVAAWFVLIGLSPVFTRQHHLADVLGGVLLAALCRHAWIPRAEGVACAGEPNRRVGCFYLAGAALLLAIAAALGAWAWLCLWPASALALVAAGYFRLGGAIWRKSRGRLAWSTCLLLGPVLLGHWLSLWFYARQGPACQALTENLWIGRRLSAREARAARRQGVSAVVDLCGEFSEAAPFRRIPCLHLPLLDLTAPTPRQLDQALAFIEAHAPGGIVYVHCKAGYSRTAAVAGAYLLATGRAHAAPDAMAQLRAARPALVIRPEARAALETFAQSLALSPPRLAPSPR